MPDSQPGEISQEDRADDDARSVGEALVLENKDEVEVHEVRLLFVRLLRPSTS